MCQRSEGLQPNLSSLKLQASFPYCSTTPQADDAWGSLNNFMSHVTLSEEAIVHFTYLGD